MTDVALVVCHGNDWPLAFYEEYSIFIYDKTYKAGECWDECMEASATSMWLRVIINIKSQHYNKFYYWRMIGFENPIHNSTGIIQYTKLTGYNYCVHTSI